MENTGGSNPNHLDSLEKDLLRKALIPKNKLTRETIIANNEIPATICAIFPAVLAAIKINNRKIRILTRLILPHKRDILDWGRFDSNARLRFLLFKITNTLPSDFLSFDLDDDKLHKKLQIQASHPSNLKLRRQYHNNLF